MSSQVWAPQLLIKLIVDDDGRSKTIGILVREPAPLTQLNSVHHAVRSADSLYGCVLRAIHEICRNAPPQ